MKNPRLIILILLSLMSAVASAQDPLPSLSDDETFDLDALRKAELKKKSHPVFFTQQEWICHLLGTLPEWAKTSNLDLTEQPGALYREMIVWSMAARFALRAKPYCDGEYRIHEPLLNSYTDALLENHPPAPEFALIPSWKSDLQFQHTSTDYMVAYAKVLTLHYLRDHESEDSSDFYKIVAQDFERSMLYAPASPFNPKIPLFRSVFLANFALSAIPEINPNVQSFIETYLEAAPGLPYSFGLKPYALETYGHRNEVDQAVSAARDLGFLNYHFYRSPVSPNPLRAKLKKAVQNYFRQLSLLQAHGLRDDHVWHRGDKNYHSGYFYPSLSFAVDSLKLLSRDADSAEKREIKKQSVLLYEAIRETYDLDTNEFESHIYDLAANTNQAHFPKDTRWVPSFAGLALIGLLDLEKGNLESLAWLHARPNNL